MIRITSTETAKMYFRGTNIEITEVVSRLAFSGPLNGKSIEVAQQIYPSMEAYENNDQSMVIDGFELHKWFDLSLGTNPETYELQTINVAHQKMKEYLEEIGFQAVIFGL